MSRVLLVNPRMCSPRSARLPLSLLHLGAVLEGRHEYAILDGNVEPGCAARAAAAVRERRHDLVGLTVMPGPQVGPSIEVSRAVRAADPEVPIVWGGYFPSMYTESALNAPYVDYVARGPGEETLLALLDALPGRRPTAADSGAPAGIEAVAGLSFKREGVPVHNAARAFGAPDGYPPLPYGRLGDLGRYLRPSFMGRRTGVHQAAIGCRYRCRFCGVVTVFDGHTRPPAAEHLRRAGVRLRDEVGADCVQLVDNNFFDTEAGSLPLVEALADVGLPWWAYARADTLAGFDPGTWRALERSKLRMVYIGAEAASPEALKRMRKGTRPHQTLEAAALCRAHGVIPEMSFVLGGPEDPESELEETLGFVKRVKRIHPEAEVILYVYTPTPQRDPAAVRADPSAVHLPRQSRYGPDGPALPATPEEWCEPRWIDYVCHRDAPWLTDRTRRRIRDFATVLGCRFPTVQDVDLPRWGRATLRELSRWRYATGVYGRPVELRLARRLIPLRRPEAEGL